MSRTPLLHRVRRRIARYRTPPPPPPMTEVTSYAEARAVLEGPAQFASRTPLLGFDGLHTLSPLLFDPPEHGRPRKVVDAVLRQHAKGLGPWLETRATTLIEGLVDRGAVDVPVEFSTPFAASGLLRTLGLPLADLPLIQDIRSRLSWPDGSATRRQASDDLDRYFHAALDERAVRPRDDGLTTVQSAAPGGRPFTRAEALDVLFTLVLAGFETVAGTLEAAMAYLAERPEARRRLMDGPGGVAPATEELLRCFGSVLLVNRRATSPGMAAGKPVAPDEVIAVSLAAANRDPEVFVDPEDLDFGRRPNRHVAFGAGVHHCPGAALARLGLQAALTAWHRSIPDYRLDGEPLLSPGPVVRRFVRLPLAWD